MTALFRLILGASLALTLLACHEHAPAVEPEIPSPPMVVGPVEAPPDGDEQDDAVPDELEVVDDDPAALTVYREDLAPHGEWVDDPEWGTVWVPSVVVVGEDFVPYKTAGRWAVADDDSWVWVSDYDWGYIPFHYGRWVWIAPRGAWAWIPGRVYAPAWVVWRVGEPGWDYVGWAAMPPSLCWYDGIIGTCRYRPVLAYWFVPSAYLFHVHWHRHVIHHHHAPVIAAHTRVYHRHGYGSRHRPARRVDASPDRRPRRMRPASPSFTEARIPARAIPERERRVTHDPRATRLAPERPRTRVPPRPPTRERATRPPRPRPAAPPRAADPRKRKQKPEARPPTGRKPRPAPRKTPSQPTPRPRPRR